MLLAALAFTLQSAPNLQQPPDQTMMVEPAAMMIAACDADGDARTSAAELAACVARSYALVVEDPDAKTITPFVHWVAWNIPASVTSLPEGVQEQMRLTEPDGLMQGKTSRGSVGYYGPRPPVGDPPHHYHVQVLALDRILELAPGADRDQLLAAAAGHVIAKGELVGTYRQEQPPLK